jgi:hypothetical protein
MFEDFIMIVGSVTVVIIGSALIIKLFGLTTLIIVGTACLLITKCSINNRHASNAEYFEYQNVCTCSIEDTIDAEILENELVAEIRDI